LTQFSQSFLAYMQNSEFISPLLLLFFFLHVENTLEALIKVTS